MKGFELLSGKHLEGLYECAKAYADGSRRFIYVNPPQITPRGYFFGTSGESPNSVTGPPELALQDTREYERYDGEWSYDGGKLLFTVAPKARTTATVEVRKYYLSADGGQFVFVYPNRDYATWRIVPGVAYQGKPVTNETSAYFEADEKPPLALGEQCDSELRHVEVPFYAAVPK